MIEPYVWVLFIIGVAGFLAVDLGVFHRRAHETSLREAVTWTGVWLAVAIGFTGFLAVWLGGAVAAEFAAGYLIEWSLSIDNVFVFVLIFTHFAVPKEYQHRVLFWGVLGAIVLRLGFVLAGAALLERFHWIIYVFGAILLVTAWRFLRERGEERSIEENAVLRVLRRFVPLTEDYEGQRLVVRRAGKVVATPLLAVLVMVEATDVVFAVDSIPAIFAVTRNAFIVFSSNALALLGLRSLYSVLSHAVTRFRYLKLALAALLTFVGLKMLLSSVVHISIAVSLAAVVGILAAGVVASLVVPERPNPGLRNR